MEASDIVRWPSRCADGNRKALSHGTNHDPVIIDQFLRTLAMQKVEGSSPFSRSWESPA
jgi:hypothetical protein